MQNPVRTTLALLWGALATGALPAAAQQQDAGAVSLDSLLNQRVATSAVFTQQVSSATRTAQRATDAPSAVTVVTAEDIARMGAVDVPDVLRMVPGLFTRTKSKGAVDMAARNITDLRSARMLVLLDGRITMMDLHSVTVWESLELVPENIERIEVVRGPGSALYGAGAYDGVISITTRRPTGGTEVEANVGAGSYGERRASGVLRQTFGAFRFDAFAARSRAELHRPLVSVRQAGTETVVARVSETDDFRKAGGRLGWSSARGANLEVAAGVSRGDGLYYYDYSDTPTPTRNGSSYLQALYTQPGVLSGGVVTAHLYHTQHDFRLQGRDDAEGVTTVGEVMLAKPLGAGHELVVGATTRRLSSGETFLTADKQTQWLHGAYLQDVWRMHRAVDLVASARADKHPLDDDLRFSPRASLLLRPSTAQTVRLSVGRAFRNPTVVESYMRYQVPVGPLVAHVRGNERLAPERITSYEAGYVSALGPRATLRADLFYNLHDSRIVVQAQDSVVLPNGVAVPLLSEWANGPEYRAIGGEASLELQLAEWLRAAANYAHTRLEAEGSRPDIRLAPRHLLNAEVAVRPVRPLWLDATYHYAGETDYTLDVIPASRMVHGYETVQLAGGSVLDVHARLELPRGLNASVFIQNALDRHHQQVIGGEMLGRRALLRLGYRF